MQELQELRRENVALRRQLEATRGFVHDPYSVQAALPPQPSAAASSDTIVMGNNSAVTAAIAVTDLALPPVRAEDLMVDDL